MNYYFKTGIIAAALVFGSAFTVGADETVKKKVEKKPAISVSANVALASDQVWKVIRAEQMLQAQRLMCMLDIKASLKA